MIRLLPRLTGVSQWHFAVLSLFIWSAASSAQERGGAQLQGDASQLNVAQQVQIEQIKENLNGVESDLRVLRTEAVKAQNVLNTIEALEKKSLDEPRLLSLFVKLNEITNALAQQVGAGTRPGLNQLVEVTQVLTEVSQLTKGLVPNWPALPTSGEEVRAVQIEVYADDGIRYTSKIPWEQLFALRNLDLANEKEPVIAEHVKSLQRTLSSITVEAIAQDTDAFRDAVKAAWSAVQGRINSAHDEREKRKKDLLEKLNELGSSQLQTDKLLIWAIIGMIFILFLIFLSAIKVASPETQRLIFSGRLLVELVGMAFLLLTIIILGTGAKIDRPVLGALLGTVGGYIFGQQVGRATREERDQKPEQPGVGPKPPDDVTQQLKNAAEAIKMAQSADTPPADMAVRLKEALQSIEKAQSAQGNSR
ncbi:MAG TPA: hypothetical protein VF794_14085 [Archangium sp.]|uniref:hypothetical protein n=1 Tax=Archangium sp. TaxID=1872627 RepID=UPI002ED880DB